LRMSRRHCERGSVASNLRRIPMSLSAGAVDRRADTRSLISHADEYPHQEEGGVQRTVGLGQSADRQVVLVRPGINAENFPGHDHRNEPQPGRNAA